MARVTLQDIAQALGVSVSTVSLALRGSERISAEVRQRVAQEAAAQGYQTDLAGSLLRTARPKIIGLVCDFGQELHVEYSREIVAAAERLGWVVMVEDTNVSGGGAAVSRVLQLRAQSLVVVNPEAVAQGAFDGLGIPVVAIGQSVSYPGADLIVSNNLPGMRQLAALLAQEPEVLCLDGGQSVSSQRRRDTLLEVMRHQGVEVTTFCGGATLDSGWEAMRAALRQGWRRQGAVVCYNDQCALGALAALWQEGIRVPHNVRLVGFDNSRIARSAAFEMTSIDKNPVEVARLAVERAVARAQGESSGPVRVEVDTHLVRRRTA